jgi:hypothetical protein
VSIQRMSCIHTSWSVFSVFNLCLIGFMWWLYPKQRRPMAPDGHALVKIAWACMPM